MADTAACDRLSVERAPKVVGVHSVHYVPDAVQPKVPPIAAGGSYHFVLGRKGVEDDVFVPLVSNHLSHLLEEATAFVRDKKRNRPDPGRAPSPC